MAAGHQCQAHSFDHPASAVTVPHHIPHAPGHPDLHHSNKCFIHGWQNRVIFQSLDLQVKKNLPSVQQDTAASAGQSLTKPRCSQPHWGYPASLTKHVGEHSGAACTQQPPKEPFIKQSYWIHSLEMENNKKCFNWWLALLQSRTNWQLMFHLLRKERACPMNAGCLVSCIASTKLKSQLRGLYSRVYLCINILD